MANRPSVATRRYKSRGQIRLEHMTRLQQRGRGDDALTVPEVAGKVRLYRIIRRRYRGNEEREQPGDAD